ncbi:MAG: CPBP family intramembrane metalloprotease [Bacteroidota bacterium]|nr:CPBP family intramembrane metalloprotease [Bacteroidota bacterium]
MIDRNSRNFSFTGQLGILLGLIGAGMIISIIVSFLIWLVMTGRGLDTMATDIMNPKYYNAIMWMQVVSTFFLFFLPVYFFALICYRNPTKFIGFNTRINYKQVLILLAIVALTFPLSGALAELTKMIPIPHSWQIYFKAKEAARNAQEKALININTFPKYLVSMIIIGLLPAIFEEVCFRGGIQNILTRWFKGPWIAIIITSVVFSLVHISYYGFLVRAVLGVFLGLVFYYSGSLWLSILFHFLYNGLQVTALYFATTSVGNSSKNAKDIEGSFPLWAGVVALVLIIYAFIKFREISILEQQKYVMPEEDPNDFQNWITKES